MTTIRRFNARSPQMPEYDRIIEAAAGINPWTDAERQARRLSPAWLLAEAQAHLELALTKDTPQAQTLELQQVTDLVRDLPTEEMRRTATELFVTYLPEHLQEAFAFQRLSRESSIERTDTIEPAHQQPRAAFDLGATVYALGNFSRRHFLAIATGSIAASVAAFFAFRFFRGKPSPDDDTFVATASRLTSVTENEPLDQSQANHNHAANSYAHLFANDELEGDFVHHSPMRYQWLVHIDKTVRLAGFSDKRGPMHAKRPPALWTEDDLEQGPNRPEFWIVVTAGKPSNSFPVGTPRPNQTVPCIDDAFLRRLRVEPDDQVRFQMLVERLTSEFGGPTKASIRVTIYKSDSQDRPE